jgi:hypothetical protein
MHTQCDTIGITYVTNISAHRDAPIWGEGVMAINRKKIPKDPLQFRTERKVNGSVASFCWVSFAFRTPFATYRYLCFTYDEFIVTVSDF